MIDINRIVELAVNNGYFISDLYNYIGMKKSGFLYIRKHKSKQFRIDYFYKLCEYLGIEIEVGLKLFDDKSTIDLKEYKIIHDYNVLNNRDIDIEQILKYGHTKGIYINDLKNHLGIDSGTFKKMRSSRNNYELKKYFFDICEYIGIPYGKALNKYTKLGDKGTI